jgi:N6-L-threonylcarbamoyladenine synthase
MIPVNHMAGHLYSVFNQSANQPIGEKVFPNVSLIVSGGHTMIVVMENEKKYKVIGQTVDDAAGEAFDKVAKLLKLPYPGGPEVSRLAEKGNPNAIAFPRPMLNHKNYNFSFSGLKTAVLYHTQSEKSKVKSEKYKQDVCASFQAAVVDVLVQKTMRAVKEYKAKSVSLSGGVSANHSLREQLKVESEKLKVKFFPAPLNLSGDNAEMIGLAAGFMLHNGFKPKNFKQVKADSNLEL